MGCACKALCECEIASLKATTAEASRRRKRQQRPCRAPARSAAGSARPREAAGWRRSKPLAVAKQATQFRSVAVDVGAAARGLLEQARCQGLLRGAAKDVGPSVEEGAGRLAAQGCWCSPSTGMYQEAQKVCSLLAHAASDLEGEDDQAALSSAVACTKLRVGSFLSVPRSEQGGPWGAAAVGLWAAGTGDR